MKEANKNKRAQVTIFIIIALVIIAGIIAFSIFKGKSSSTVPKEVESINNFVESCIRTTAYEGIYQLGLYGGYYKPGVSFDDGMAIYLSKQHISIPEKQEISNQLESYIKDNLNVCLNNFSNFKDFKISAGSFSANSTFYQESIAINAVFPITITKGDASYELNNFDNIRINVPFGKMYDAAVAIVNENAENESVACLSCLSREAESRNLSINMINKNNATLFLIYDYRFENNKTYNLIFARTY